jgi:AcrR family transcriptional regulator
VTPLPTLPTLKTTAAKRIDVGRIRREQIVEAAVQIIVHQGLPSLSLSKIERAAGMKRGQLTYYFPTKEDILLAVFDRLLQLMYQRIEESEGPREERLAKHTCWDCVQKMLQTILMREPLGAEFHALQYTFLAQIAHRDDFRKRLASLYEEWRNGFTQHWKSTATPFSPLATAVSPRVLASFLQALVHGLLVQLAADPEAFDRNEMLTLCVGVLMPLFTDELPARTRPQRNGRQGRAKEDSRD